MYQKRMKLFHLNIIFISIHSFHTIHEFINIWKKNKQKESFVFTPFIKREICNSVKCVFGSNKYDVMPLKFED